MSATGALGRILLICAVFLQAGFLHAAAQTAPTAPTAPESAAIDDFARAFKGLKEGLADLPKKIEETHRQIEANSEPATAQQQLDVLRGVVSQVLGLVADNGSVARLGQTALAASRNKLGEQRQNTQFTQEQKDYLVREWQRVVKETEGAVADLDAARREVAELLRIVQSNEDYLKELQALHQAHQTIEVIKNLTVSLRDISHRLRDLIQNRMKVPSM